MSNAGNTFQLQKDHQQSSSRAGLVISPTALLADLAIKIRVIMKLASNTNQGATLNMKKKHQAPRTV